MELIEVKNDVLGIVDRIKSWNKKYSIFYNLKTKKYILYIIENELKPKEYSLTFPFSNIDERMIEYVQKSEIQNRNAYIEEIEKANALLMKREHEKYLEKMENEYESKRHS